MLPSLGPGAYFLKAILAEWSLERNQTNTVLSPGSRAPPASGGRQIANAVPKLMRVSLAPRALRPETVPITRCPQNALCWLSNCQRESPLSCKSADSSSGHSSSVAMQRAGRRPSWLPSVLYPVSVHIRF